VSSDQLVNETSAVTAQCVVQANPLNVVGLITWYHVQDPDVQVLAASVPDVEVLELVISSSSSMATSRLLIAHASTSNAGRYRCVAYNGLGLHVNATTNVIVLSTYIVLRTYVYARILTPPRVFHCLLGLLVTSSSLDIIIRICCKLVRQKSLIVCPLIALCVSERGN